ncbi:MAG: hypothetical protein LW833_00370 [Hyphomicrobiales bacterium]|nr:hypothetical protein [Methylobacterium sp.]MCE2931404.1 hypothetical protein [Hyphomicrobiales bacterium]
MFSWLKNKYWGKEIFGLEVGSRGDLYVYLWEKDGSRTVNIRSSRFSYVQAPGRNDGTVTFEMSEAESLIRTIQSVLEASSMFKMESGTR